MILRKMTSGKNPQNFEHERQCCDRPRPLLKKMLLFLPKQHSLNQSNKVEQFIPGIATLNVPLYWHIMKHRTNGAFHILPASPTGFHKLCNR